MTIDPTWVHVGRQPQEELVRLFPLVATTNSRYTEKPTTAPVDGYKNNTYSVLNFLSWKSLTWKRKKACIPPHPPQWQMWGIPSLS